MKTVLYSHILSFYIDYSIQYHNSYFSSICDLFLKKTNFLFKNLKSAIAFGLILFLLPTTANAISIATTVNKINGNPPYIELNGYAIKDLKHLLSIKVGNDIYISDSSGNMFKDKGDGTYEKVYIITLPNIGDTFSAVKTVVPPDTQVYQLDDINIIPLSVKKDDDGDGNFSIKGKMEGKWLDNNGEVIREKAPGISDLTKPLNICRTPYTLTLSSSANPQIDTQYGLPNTFLYGNGTAKFKIDVLQQPAICFARPNLSEGKGIYAGPTNMWDSSMGFKTQPTYAENFPTMASDQQYFDIFITGVKNPLNWQPVTVGNITASFSNITTGSVRVTLNGPNADTLAQGGKADTFTNPTQIVLEGKDANGKTIVSYGFVLRKWFVNRKKYLDTANSIEMWCFGLGDYRVPGLLDVTNGVNSLIPIVPQHPNPLGRNNYYRRIGGGLFSEWGNVGQTYAQTGWLTNAIWVSDMVGDYQVVVEGAGGVSHLNSPGAKAYGACVSKN